MIIVPKPEQPRSNDNTRLKEIYLKIVACKPNCIQAPLQDLTPADVVQLYRYAKKDNNRLHTSVKDGVRLIWID